MNFKIESKIKGKLGRAGVLETSHGRIETPAFVAVGTKATVKSLTPEQVRSVGAEIILANTYHLFLTPGAEIVKKAGGLSKFMNWSGPTMTDSGGFQVFSLGAGIGRQIGKVANRKSSDDIKTPDLDLAGKKVADPSLVSIDEDGVDFRSHIDGSKHRFTPERSIEIQHDLGADIIFAFDECSSPVAPYEYQKEAMDRTHRWATRSLARHRDLKVESKKQKNEESTGSENTQALFGIVQGGRHEDLRKESARIIGAMEFDGFGIGGSFDKEDMDSAVLWVNEILPEEKPRHLLGIGEPSDLFGAVENGCDLFDCVAPTRLARNGALYGRGGRINILNAKFTTDFSPIERGCGCYTCKNFSRAYLAHLFRSNEILAKTLASIHNLYFIVNLVKQMRQAILAGSFEKMRSDFTLGV